MPSQRGSSLPLCRPGAAMVCRGVSNSFGFLAFYRRAECLLQVAGQFCFVRFGYLCWRRHLGFSAGQSLALPGRALGALAPRWRVPLAAIGFDVQVLEI